MLLALEPPPGAKLLHALAFVGTVVVAAILTAIMKRVSMKLDFVSRPRADRWARTVVPLGGGVAIFVAAAIGLPLVSERLHESLELVVALSAIFLLGLIDDKVRLSAPTKLVVQLVAASFLVWRGWTLPIGPDLLRVPVTVGWFVFLANSVNLLDNMDGSAAGVSAVASGVVYVIAVGGTQPDPHLAAQAAVLCGAAIGFLLHNFPPASIFMGDAGSLVLGFGLAALAARLPKSAGQSLASTAIAPALVLALPIFDTALVWAARRAAKRPFLLGGGDHTTHRLVKLGLSERRTVLLLYGVAALLGAAALAVARGGVGTAVLVGLVVATGLLLCGVFLVDVRVYKKTESQIGIPVATAMKAADSQERDALRYAVEIVADVAIVSAAWVGSYVVRFEEPALYDYLMGSCLNALPFVIGLKLATFLALGLYRGFWRSIQFGDTFRILQACAIGSVLVIATAALTERLENYSRLGFVLDFVFCTSGIFFSRAAVRALRASVAKLAVEPRRGVLIGPRVLAPLVERGIARDGNAPWRLVAVVDPAEIPAETSPEKKLDAIVALVAQQAEPANASVALLGAPELDRVALARSLGDRGITLLGVTVGIE